MRLLFRIGPVVFLAGLLVALFAQSDPTENPPAPSSKPSAPPATAPRRCPISTCASATPS